MTPPAAAGRAPAGSPAITARRMPAEWELHERTWMAFPPGNDTFGPDGGAALHRARVAWAAVANAIVAYEPVTLLVPPGQVEVAREYVSSGVELVEQRLDDAWVRDTGPTFTIEADGSLGAVDWIFNGWGAQDWATWEQDSKVGADIAAQAGVTARSSRLVNEGGGIHVDGDGTVLLTETVQLDAGRNPGWTREQVEAEVHDQLGSSKAIWLPRGLGRDYERYGTGGHVDLVACFTAPGVLAFHDQRDPAHPDYEVTAVITAHLEAETDADGNPLELVPIAAPQLLAHDGLPTDFSYINHYVGNGFVIVPIFDDPSDADAIALLATLYPGRAVEAVDGVAIFENGGGVHCITQQQPAV